MRVIYILRVVGCETLPSQFSGFFHDLPLPLSLSIEKYVFLNVSTYISDDLVY